MKIKYFSWLKEITKTDFEEIHEKSIKDVESLISFICTRYPKLNKFFNPERVIQVAINLEYSYSNKKISLNDEIAFFPPVSGG